MRRALLVLAALLAAGCVGPASPATEEEGRPSGHAAAGPWGGFPDPLVTGHDHDDAAAHALSTPTMERLASLAPLDFGLPPVIFGEADLLGEDHLVLAGAVGGFYVVDVADRAAPRVVSYTPLPGFVADVKAIESGTFVFVGVQLAGFTGIQAYHVGVPERPLLAGAFPLEGGCHMLAVYEGHLYCAPSDATVRIFRIQETAAAALLVPVGIYAPQGAPLTPLTLRDAGEEFTHDVTVQADPLTGEPIMLVSFWDYGVRAVDVKDPAHPVEIAAWTGEGADDVYEGNVHTTMAVAVEGRRILITVPEYAVQPSVTFLDATDWGNVTVAGVWAAKPDGFGNDDHKQFSTHNFQAVGGRVYMAMYHGGVVVLDASSLEAMRMPRVVGYHLPAGETALGRGGPSTWDVVLKEGHLYALDMRTGLHVLRYAEDTLGDPALTSFA